MNSLGWAERHGNRAGGAKGVRWGAGPGQVRLGDLQKLRGPGTNGNEAGCARTAWARTAWAGAKGLWVDGPGTGAKARESATQTGLAWTQTGADGAKGVRWENPPKRQERGGGRV